MAASFLSHAAPSAYAKGIFMTTGLAVLGTSLMLMLIAVWWIFRHR